MRVVAVVVHIPVSWKTKNTVEKITDAQVKDEEKYRVLSDALEILAKLSVDSLIEEI